MDDNQNSTPSGAPAPTSGAARPVTQIKPPSGLTGQILPTFWQQPKAASAETPLPLPPASEEPEAPEPTASGERVAAGLTRWSLRAMRSRPDPLALLLLLCALLALGIYLSGTLRFPLAAYLKPRYQDIGQLTSLPGGRYDQVAGEWLLLAIVLLFGAWGLA
jgi:hypothetical protein